MKNIAFIGMPGAGKSVIGKKLAYRLGYIFFDLDDYIEVAHDSKLQDIVDKAGEKKFLKLEERLLLRFLKDHHRRVVIAPGGSIVYSKKGMAALRKDFFIIFIDVPTQLLEKRISDWQRRGVIGIKSKTLKEVYEERLPLYQKYADITITVGKHSEEKVLKKITALVSKRVYKYLK